MHAQCPVNQHGLLTYGAASDEGGDAGQNAPVREGARAVTRRGVELHPSAGEAEVGDELVDAAGLEVVGEVTGFRGG